MSSVPGVRPIVVFTEADDVDPGAGAVLLESRGFEVVVLPGRIPDASSAESLPERVAAATAAIVGLSPIGAAELARLPALRVLCTTSTGVDMIDLAAADERGIEVVGLGGVATAEVAVHALTLILAALRELPAGRAVVVSGGWTSDLAAVPPDIGSLTLGLVGFGRIGRELARIARPLFARIVAADPVATEAEHGVELIPLDDVLASSDVVSLHLPATAESRGLLSADRLATMRPGALLVNVSRGELVDEAAVLDALDSGRLGAFAADVLDGEPPAVDSPLRDHPRAIVTPHMAFLSTASLVRYELDPARAVIERLGA
ncbi:C-terminal binding protein [Labedella endophytica]|uniref:C-terminal binding protein n=1 Tax=Labedella endophytica TaxID=1523160 RepID=A0A3S0XNZ0_9MICO|nr:C-terminal binding protein [Labedella endophytica]RUR01753.1 C-terminal binding protein [Labedella endophytica]